MNNTHLYAVAHKGLTPVQTLEILIETPSAFILSDKTIVYKASMRDKTRLYFAERQSADKTFAYLSEAAYISNTINIETILNCKNPTSMALILFNMIQELCEDGMPTHKCIEEYLNSPAREEEKQTEEDTYGLEEYDTLKQGDTIFYIDHHKNVQRGRVFKISRGKNGRISYISVDAPNDFLGIDGANLGKTLFIRKHVAAFFSQQ